MGLSKKVLGFVMDKENVVHMLLVGAFAALGARSWVQQGEIDALEAEKQSLRKSNRAMQKSMWEWRQALSSIYQDDPAASPISLAKLRSIYGEDEDSNQHSATYPAPVLPYVQAGQEGVSMEHGVPNPASATIAV